MMMMLDRSRSKGLRYCIWISVGASQVNRLVSHRDLVSRSKAVGARSCTHRCPVQNARTYWSLPLLSQTSSWNTNYDYVRRIFCCRGLGWRSGCATSRTVRGSILGGIAGFFSDIFLPTPPADRLSPKWKWVQGLFSAGKGGRSVTLKICYIRGNQVEVIANLIKLHAYLLRF